MRRRKGKTGGIVVFVRTAQIIRGNLAMSSLAVFSAGLLVGCHHPLPVLRLLIPLALLLMLFPAFVDMDWERIGQVAARPLPLLLALLFNLLAAPVLMSGLLSWAAGTIPAGLTVGLLIFGMIPAGGMGPAYTGMLGGNVNLSVAISALSLLLSLGSVPFWSWLLIGKVVAVPVFLIARYLFLIIVLPMILAITVRTWIIRQRGAGYFYRQKDLWRHVSVLGLVMILFIIPAGDVGFQAAGPALLVGLILPAAAFSVLLVITAVVAGKVFRLPYGDRIALTVGATTKNTAIAMALATTAFSGREALAVAVAGPLVQLPVMLCYLEIQGRLSGGPEENRRLRSR